MTANKPHTLKGDLAHLPAALAPLVALDHWLLWRWEFRRGNWTKPPYTTSGSRAKNNDPNCEYRTMFCPAYILAGFLTTVAVAMMM